MDTAKTTETYNILNRFSGQVQCSVEIECAADTLPSVKLGFAVKVALAEKKNLRGADLRGAKLRGAKLRGADLYSADLSGANLSGTDLSGANLYSANLYSADLRGAKLRGTDLSGANLYGADLRGTDLSGAKLRGANLYGADLSGADLRGTDLRGAKLRGAKLRGAKLRGANLYSANLYSADLRGANLRGAKDITLPAFQIPQEGELIVYKKLQGGVIAKLRVPPEARRTATPIGRKCRAEFVEVLEGEGYDQHTGRTWYAPGTTVHPDSYDDSPLIECTHGIHFFLTVEEAEAY